MATVFTHSLVAVSLGKAYSGRSVSARFLALSVACSVLPDLDVIGLVLGVPYGSFWGHRGFSHSLLFACVVGIIVGCTGLSGVRNGSTARWPRCIYFAIVTASHGVLDAFTDGGLGIAFFSPFDTNRYFFGWRPLVVSPIGADFFSRRGLEVLESEAIWIWVPCLLLLIATRLCLRKPRAPARG